MAKPEKSDGPDNVVPIKDAEDLSSLWTDTGLGDGLTTLTHHSVSCGRPKNFFFRVVPDRAYRHMTEMYVHKPEGIISDEHYLVDKPMRGKIPEAQPCLLVTVVDRNGLPRLWPLKFPKEGQSDFDAWVAVRRAAKLAMSNWIRLVWTGRSYTTRNAPPGYAPDPDYAKPPFVLPSFDELVNLAFGEHGIIRDESHPIYRELFGTAPADGGADDDDDDELA